MRILGLSAVLAVASAAAALAGQAVLDGRGGGVTLLSGPDRHYAAVAVARSGTRVTTYGGTMTAVDKTVMTIDGALGWTLIRLPSGVQGWVPNSRLAAPGAYRVAAVPAATSPKPKPEAVPETAPTTVPEEIKAYTSVVWPHEGRLNLRAGPGTSFEVLDVMERGDFVAVSAKAGDWVKIRHENGAEGWAHKEYLTR